MLPAMSIFALEPRAHIGKAMDRPLKTHVQPP
jgi:hypothetical protein